MKCQNDHQRVKSFKFYRSYKYLYFFKISMFLYGMLSMMILFWTS